jgi:choline-sulfatase
VHFRRRDFLLTTTGAAFAADKKPVQRPNILLVLADDLAAWMLGCYGNKEIKTPNIDQLARSGMRFANSFVATPICSASRATLFTGRMPRQHGIHDYLTEKPIDSPPQGQAAPPASFEKEVMVSDVFTGAGYRCGYVGKWHMGQDQRPGHGYQYTYTMLGGSRSYRDPEMFLNGERVQEQGYLTELMTRRACEFLEQQSASSPFFLTVGYLNPHTPYEGHPQKYYDMYAGTNFDTVGWEPAYMS